jgi:hypothetical protein
MLARAPCQARGYRAAKSLAGKERILGREPAGSATCCTSGLWRHHALPDDSISGNGTPKVRTGHLWSVSVPERQSLARSFSPALPAPEPGVYPLAALSVRRVARRLREVKRDKEKDLRSQAHGENDGQAPCMPANSHPPTRARPPDSRAAFWVVWPSGECRPRHFHSKTKLILGVFLNRPVPHLWAASLFGDIRES